MVIWPVSIFFFAVVQAQLPLQNFQFPSFPTIPATTFGNPNAFTALFPWLNNNNNNNDVNKRASPTIVFPGQNGLSTNSFFPWTLGNGPISGPLSQAFQVPLQAFSNIFRPQGQLNNLNNLPGLSIFQRPAGATLQSLKPPQLPQEIEEIEDEIPDITNFPVSEVRPGQSNTPGSNIIAGVANEDTDIIN